MVWILGNTRNAHWSGIHLRDEHHPTKKPVYMDAELAEAFLWLKKMGLAPGPSWLSDLGHVIKA